MTTKTFALGGGNNKEKFVVVELVAPDFGWWKSKAECQKEADRRNTVEKRK